jgi:flagellar biosynthesis component FlhA
MVKAASAYALTKLNITDLKKIAETMGMTEAAAAGASKQMLIDFIEKVIRRCASDHFRAHNQVMQTEEANAEIERLTEALAAALADDDDDDDDDKPMNKAIHSRKTTAPTTTTTTTKQPPPLIIFDFQNSGFYIVLNIFSSFVFFGFLITLF